jgi:hypothetical protein
MHVDREWLLRMPEYPKFKEGLTRHATAWIVFAASQNPLLMTEFGATK